MSRPCYVDSEDQIPAGIWHANLRRILHGKRGQRILRDLERTLLNMPKHRLLKDQIVNWSGECCLLGAYAVQKEVDTGYERDAAIVDLLFDEYDDWCSMQRSAELGQTYGIPWTLAWELAQANDETTQELVHDNEYYASGVWDEASRTYRPTKPKYVSSPEERWQSCLNLIRAWIKEGESVPS